MAEDPTVTGASDQLITELIRFSRLAARMKAMLSQHDPGGDQSALLLLGPLMQEGPLRVTDLAELRYADPSTVSRQAAQLVRTGLVRREADPVDGRASRLALTAAGQATCRRMQAARRDFVDGALRDWPAERVALFTDLFRDFNSSVEAYRPGACAVDPAGSPPIQESP